MDGAGFQVRPPFLFPLKQVGRHPGFNQTHLSIPQHCCGKMMDGLEEYLQWQLLCYALCLPKKILISKKYGERTKKLIKAFETFST